MNINNILERKNSLKIGIILLSLIILTLSSCIAQSTPPEPSYTPPPINTITSYYAKYAISLSKIERPEKASKRYGRPKIDKITNGKYNYKFEDAMVKVLWLFDADNIFFYIQNKTDLSIKIPWDEAAFIDDNNLSHSVMHTGVKYSDRANPQAPSIIAGKASIDDTVFPTDYVSWKEGNNYGAGSWVIQPFLLSRDIHAEKISGKYPTFEAFESAAKSNIGKWLQVILPLQIEDVINDYIFTFVVDNVVCSQETKTY